MTIGVAMEDFQDEVSGSDEKNSLAETEPCLFGWSRRRLSEFKLFSP